MDYNVLDRIRLYMVVELFDSIMYSKKYSETPWCIPTNMYQ